MERVYGSPKRQDGLYKIGRNKYQLIYGFGEDENGGWNWREDFRYRPMMPEIKSIINATISEAWDEKKRTGFSWQGIPVRYDEEAERNLTGLSVKMPRLGSAMFPLTFKLGEHPDGTPAFYQFETQEEFEQFTDSLMAHTQECYAGSWEEKATVDWTKYEEVIL